MAPSIRPCHFNPLTAGTENDTMHETDSHNGIIRRLSTLLHTSFRATRLMSQRNSECSSVNSMPITRSLSTSSPTHTLLRRATSKTAKGSSIIRKDGSVIITKNGKIISVRRDTDSLKRDVSFSGFEDIKARRKNGVSKSLSEINVINGELVELTPLLKANLPVMNVKNSEDLNGSSENVGAGHAMRMKFSHVSLTKIDSVDENEVGGGDGSPTGNKLLRIPSSRHQQLSQSDDEIAKHAGEATLPLLSSQTGNSSSSLIPNEIGQTTHPFILKPIDKSYSPSVSINSDEVFVQSPSKLSPAYCSQIGLLDAMPLEPLYKDKAFARSDNNLDVERNASNHPKDAKPVLFLRYPSIEKLDLPAAIPRCNSDAASAKKRSPLKWLSNKLADEPIKSKT